MIGVNLLCEIVNETQKMSDSREFHSAFGESSAQVAFLRISVKKSTVVTIQIDIVLIVRY